MANIRTELKPHRFQSPERQKKIQLFLGKKRNAKLAK